MYEKRKFVRLNVGILSISFRKSHCDERVLSTIKNISEGGIRLLLGTSALKVGDIIELDFELPQRSTIRCRGRIAWVDSFEIVGGQREKRFEAGVQFLDITDVDRRTISEFVFSAIAPGEGHGTV